MRASLNDIRKTEQFLQGKLDVEENLLFEARILTNPVLRANVAVQRKIYEVVQAFHRKRLKRELRIVHLRLFSDPARKGFQREIQQHFQH
jgi:hypothetical protein